MYLCKRNLREVDMKNQRILKIFPLLIVASILLLGSCNKVSQIRSSEPRHSIVVIHSWDSIGEEKELFSTTGISLNSYQNVLFINIYILLILQNYKKYLIL